MKAQLHLSVEGEEIAVSHFFKPGSVPRWTGVVLHGAGASSKERGDTLCAALIEQGVRMYSFDFSGFGESTHIFPGSIKKRIDEAAAVIRQLLEPLNLPLVVLAFSMSGQVAIELLRVFGNKIQCLVLFNPAIYDKAALTVPFGIEFSAIIRQPMSWRNADLASPFAQYRGKLLLVRSEYDDVIPLGVFDLIVQAAACGSVSRLMIRNAPHQLGAFFSEHPDEASDIAAIIVSFLSATKHVDL